MLQFCEDIFAALVALSSPRASVGQSVKNWNYMKKGYVWAAYPKGL
jgi:hypothetical protein